MIDTSSKEHLMLRIRLSCLLLAWALTGCSIPYQTPEAVQQIERDLHLVHGSVQAMTRTNWCYLPYGSGNGGDGQCHAVQGLGVLSGDGLILSTYSGGIYERFMTLKASDVQCIKVFRDREAPASFFVFTREVATQIIPLTANGQFDTSAKICFLDYLAGQSQVNRINSDRDYVRESGKTNSVVSHIPDTKLLVVSSVIATEVFNPCTEK